MERNIKLTIAYDGSAFVGWQRQPAHHGMSIQQQIEDALTALLGHKVVIHGAGRTDTGVHALGQTANFFCDKPLPIDKLAEILNNLLPSTIRITAAVEAAPDFHARFTPHKKRYRYLIEQGRRCSPFAANYSWQLDERLHLETMQRAAGDLVGRHDFQHYTLAKATVQDFVREIYSLQVYQPPQAKAAFFPWQQLCDPLLIEVVGNGFLYKMVRIIAGRLVAIGRGELPPTALGEFLRGERKDNVPPAPAKGLFLDHIWYADECGTNSGDLF